MRSAENMQWVAEKKEFHGTLFFTVSASLKESPREPMKKAKKESRFLCELHSQSISPVELDGKLLLLVLDRSSSSVARRRR